MTNQTEQGAVPDLRAALQRLDAACDRRASLLDAAAYSAAIAIPGMQEALDELDAARSSARAALAHTPEGCGSDGWISVDDARKPPPGKAVIFWVYAERHGEDTDGGMTVTDVSGVHTGEWRVWEHGSYFDCHSSPFADVEAVTYWMDPAAPGAAAATAKDKP
jgi:hypothetical protein